jgi:eukaryotic-like serine/threonine-protein kinase
VALEAGTRVGRYTIGRLLAQGGMAEVYRADQELTKGISRPVAVKVIRPEYSESPDFREMFLDEARTACTLSHPNIAQIYDVGESDEGLLYMAMELVPGETLATINRTLRDHQERFSDEALFAIGIWTAGALEVVHALKTEGGASGLVHRDVSPHNLLLSSGGSLKLIDFGIAKAATNRNLTMPGVTKGKAGYFSPEQAMGKRLDGRSDLFSLGVTLYKLASGSTPFDDHPNHGERHAALVRGQWKPLEDVFPGLPGTFYQVVNRALMLKPEDRFQTARELREALEKASYDSGLRVGQSSLLGYVDDDGEITATGGTRSSAFPAIIAAPSDVYASPKLANAPFSGKSATSLQPLAPRPKDVGTERVARAAAPGRRTLLATAFAAALIIGVFGTLLLVGAPARAPTVDVEAITVTPTATDPSPQPTEAAPPPTPVVKLPTVDLSVAPAKAPEPRAPRPPPVKVPKVERPVEPKPAEVVAVKPAPVEEVVPDGEGTLRIGVQGDDTGARVLVTGRKALDEAPPFSSKVPSGRYTVVVKFSSGRSTEFRCTVKPDGLCKNTWDTARREWLER